MKYYDRLHTILCSPTRRDLFRTYSEYDKGKAKVVAHKNCEHRLSQKYPALQKTVRPGVNQCSYSLLLFAIIEAIDGC
jgi:hypothetical protein